MGPRGNCQDEEDEIRKKQAFASSLPCHQTNSHGGMWWSGVSNQAKCHHLVLKPDYAWGIVVASWSHTIGVPLRSLFSIVAPISSCCECWLVWVHCSHLQRTSLSEMGTTLLSITLRKSAANDWLTLWGKHPALLPQKQGQLCGVMDAPWWLIGISSLSPASLTLLHLRATLLINYLYKNLHLGLYIHRTLPKARVTNHPRMLDRGGFLGHETFSAKTKNIPDKPGPVVILPKAEIWILIIASGTWVI